MLQRFFRTTAALAALSLPLLVGAQHAGHGTPPSQTGTSPAGTTHTGHVGGKLALRLVSGTVVAVPPGIRETSAFLVLKNTGRTRVTLKAATTPVAGRTILMVTTRTSAMTGMRHAPTLTVPAGGTLRMNAAGDHVMLEALRRPLKLGEKLTFTLTDAAGRTTKVSATVKKP